MSNKIEKKINANDLKIQKRIQELIQRREQVIGEVNAINGGIFELERQLSKNKEVKNG